MIALRAGSATDVGLVRSNNQDTLLVADPLYAVADGMGGAAAGEVASSLAVEALKNGFDRVGTPTPDSLITAAQTANRTVWDEAEAHPEMRGMGTTLVALALVEGPQLAVINIGDSRLYNLHAGDLRQVTCDHNLVAEMVAEGRISKEEAEVHPRRNIMTRALGVEPEVPVDLFVEEPVVGDRYLLCSDGLPRELSDDHISAIMRRLADPAEAARELVDEAKRKGGNDNITVVVVDVVDVDAADPPPAAAVPAGDEATTAIPAAEQAVPAQAVEPVVERRSRRRFWRRSDRDRRAVRRAVTPRVVGFVLLFLVIVGAGAAGVVWYARSAYFVGLRHSAIVIYQGRPGGVLWMKPTVAQVTSYSTSDVLAVHIPALQAGQEEPSIGAAHSYVQNLVREYQQAQAANSAPTATTPSTTVAPSSPAPTTTVAAPPTT
ncbi:MAG TPA: Stp1/IreP family PP2C-type Ser/Thr phosphatase [Acidimicrobiales bacterium]|nr:Stp1/IreP family PP2C-type Ser/Thr phosphatase [Acidimicrobiales bacterium]